MNDRLGVGIDAAPPGERIEAADGTLLRLEKCPSDPVPIQQLAEGDLIASCGHKIAVKKRIPVELGAAVDKGRDTAEGQIAAKALAIEDGTLDPEPRCGGERAQRGHRIVGALQ